MEKTDEFVRVECDGVDYTAQLKKYGAHSLLFLNINSYGRRKKALEHQKGKTVD